MDFAGLMERVRAGCPRAAREVVDRYGDHLRRIVRRRLNQRLRTQYDSLDFLQDVWASVFTGPARWRSFATPADLLRFLARLASNKVVEAARRRLKTQKHDLKRERSLEHAVGDAASAAPIDPAARQPTPSQVVMAAERWEGLLRGQPARYRHALELLRQGHTHTEVAEQLGFHPKLIQRLLRKLNPTPEPR
jgi:RNA polymerase sigma-70 factor (ECF subfamily)